MEALIWLTKEMFDSEFFSPELGFTVYWRDLIGQKGGGVIILVRSARSSEVSLYSTQTVKTSGSS